MTRYRNVTSELMYAARRLRSEMTPSEKVLWSALRGRQLGFYRFRRQCPLGGYVLDFCCPEFRLAIEVDGSVHDGNEDADAVHTEHIETFGYRVLRIRNEHIQHDLTAALLLIKTALAEPTLPLPLAAAGGRGPGG